MASSAQQVPPGAAPFFAADVDVRAGRLSLSGELDLLTAPKLEAAAAIVLRGAAGQVVVSLRELRFIDASGLGAIVRLHNQARADRRRLAIVDVPEPIRRVFWCAGLGSLLRAEPSSRAG